MAANGRRLPAPYRAKEGAAAPSVDSRHAGSIAMPLLLSASTFAAAWLRALRQTLGVFSPA
jgi:hypothetical protein